MFVAAFAPSRSCPGAARGAVRGGPPGRLGILLAVLGVLTACEEKPRQAAPRRHGDRVLSIGGTPRVPLRYGFRPGLMVIYRLRTEQRLVRMPGLPGPQTRFVSMTVDRVRGPRAQLRWREEPEPGATTQGPGRALWLQITERGVVEAVAPGRGQGALEDWYKQALLAVLPRFPKEALGPGARWRESRTQELTLLPKHPAAKAHLEAEYTLERIGPCGQTRCADVSVSVAVQMVHRVASRQLSGEGKGRGRLRLDLGRGVLVSSSSRSDMEIRMAAEGVALAERVHTLQELEEVRAPGPPAAPASRATPAPTDRPSARGSGRPDAPRAR